MSSLPLDTLSHLPPLDSSSRVKPPSVEKPTDTGSFQEHLDEPQARANEATDALPEEAPTGPAEFGDETEPAEQHPAAESETEEQAEGDKPNEDHAEEVQTVRNGTPTPFDETLSVDPSAITGRTSTDTQVTSEEIAVPSDTAIDVAVSAANSAENTTLTAESVLQQTEHANQAQQSAASLTHDKPAQAENANNEQLAASSGGAAGSNRKKFAGRRAWGVQ